MQHLSWGKNELILVVFAERATGGHGGECQSEICQIEAGLGVGCVLIVNSEEPVPLRTYVADLQEDIAGQLALDRKVVLRRVLSSERRGELPKEKNRTIQSPIHRLVPRRVQKGVGNVGKSGALVGDERRAKQGIRDTVADTEGRFRAELFEHELFDGIVEKSPTHADGGLVGAAGKLG